jgi:tetratricopeptide (TPR) repeat protein
MKRKETPEKGKTRSLTSVPGAGLKRYIPWLAGILLITGLIYLPSLRNGFVTFDDPQYVVDNPYIKGFSPENLRTVLTTDANGTGNYHPLTMLSYMVNYSISGLDPASYHLVNLLLHLVNTLLVFWLALLLFTATGLKQVPLAASVAALLFGIHPLHVESVAWISARKDLLYTCFYLLALLSYIWYAEKKSRAYYLLSLVFFVLSLLSKGMAVTLSLAVVAVDYLLKRDLLQKRVILEKAPFFILSLGFGVLAVAVQQAQGATEIIRFGFFDRVVFASYGLTQYLVKMVFPYELCGYYPYPDLEQANIPVLWYFALAPALLTAGLLVYYARVKVNRTIVFGLLFFLINVIFVLQLFPVGSAVMADRYTYLSSFGLLFVLAAGAAFLWQKHPVRRNYIMAALVAYGLVLSVITVNRFGAWKDRYSFWEDVVRKYPRFYPALNNLGEFYENDGETEKALQFFNRSIEANSQNQNAYFHRGSIYGKAGRTPEAIEDFTRAIRYYPGFTQAYINRAIARAMQGDSPGAMADLDTVIARGGNESAFFNRGILKNQIRDYDGAIADFREAITLNPSCLQCYYSMGIAFFHTQKYDEAIRSFSSCLGLNPAYGYAWYYRGASYLQNGDSGKGCADLEAAVKYGVKEAAPLRDSTCR